jgi:DNA-binding NarL/FixJ family response regulator
MSVRLELQRFLMLEVILDTLKPIEKEILILVAQGYTNREIAKKLGLAEQTVRIRRVVVYEKLGVSNSAKLINYTWKMGWGNKSSDAELV